MKTLQFFEIENRWIDFVDLTNLFIQYQQDENRQGCLSIFNANIKPIWQWFDGYTSCLDDLSLYGKTDSIIFAYLCRDIINDTRKEMLEALKMNLTISQMWEIQAATFDEPFECRDTYKCKFYYSEWTPDEGTSCECEVLDPKDCPAVQKRIR